MTKKYSRKPKRASAKLQKRSTKTKNIAAQRRTQARLEAEKLARKRSRAAKKAAATRKLNREIAAAAAEKRSRAAKKAAATRKRKRTLAAAAAKVTPKAKAKPKIKAKAKPKPKKIRAKASAKIATERKAAERERLEKERRASLKQERLKMLGKVALRRRQQLSDLKALAKRARPFLPKSDNRKLSFSREDTGTRGFRIDVPIDLHLIPENLEEILYLVKRGAERIFLLRGDHPVWMTTLWLTAIGGQLAGSPKLATSAESMAARAGLKGDWQALNTASSGVFRTVEGAIEGTREVLEEFTRKKFASTDVYVHRVTVWNYTPGEGFTGLRRRRP